MTDKARELLERCAFQLGNENMTYWNAGLVEEIRDFLSTPEPTQDEEPVAYLYDLDAYCDHRPEQDVLARKIPKGIPSEYLKNVRPLYLHPAPRPEPEQDQERLELIGELHPNGLVDFVNDEMPIHHVFPVKLYAKGEALINERAKCTSDILLGKDHHAPREPFLRLSEEEVNNLLDACGVGRDWNYQLICAVENRLVEKNK